MKINIEIIDAAYLYGKEKVEDLNTKTLVPKMMLRRRMTTLAKIAVELANNVNYKDGRIVYGSCYGELLPTSKILNALNETQPLSPTEFQNSVYNTAVSYLSLIQKNQNEIMTVSNGDNTSESILNVGAVKAMDGDEILLVLVDSINIDNIEQVSTCIDYKEVGVALRIKVTQATADINCNDFDTKAFKGFMPSSHKLLYLAKEYQKGKKVFEVEL